MTSIFLALLTSYGLCFGLMNDKAKWLTDLLKRLPVSVVEGETFFTRMLVCPYCTGFHTGWFVWVALFLPKYWSEGTLNYLDSVEALAFGFASSVFCYAVDTLIQWFEK